MNVWKVERKPVEKWNENRWKSVTKTGVPTILSFCYGRTQLKSTKWRTGLLWAPRKIGISINYRIFFNCFFNLKLKTGLASATLRVKN